MASGLESIRLPTGRILLDVQLMGLVLVVSSCPLPSLKRWFIGLVNAYGTYASFYMNYLMTGKDLLYFNLIGGTQSAVVLGLSGIVGRFLDAGFTRYLILLGTVLVSLGTFTLGWVNGDGGVNQGNFALTWLTQGFISGLGMACFFVSSSQGEFLSIVIYCQYSLTMHSQWSLHGSRRRRDSPSAS